MHRQSVDLPYCWARLLGRRPAVATVAAWACFWVIAAITAGCAGGAATPPTSTADSVQPLDSLSEVLVDDAQTDVVVPPADSLADGVVGTDAGQPIDDAADSLADAASDGASDDAGCHGAGCACSENGQCDSGYCLETAQGSQCAQTCQQNCPDGFVCKTLSTGSDVTSLCVPLFPRLCEPCNADADCAAATGGSGSACVPYQGAVGLLGGFCGASCDAASPCPSGYSCDAVTSVGGAKSQQCRKIDQQCSCDARAVKLGLQTGCSLTSGAGTCAGKRSCSATGLSGCDAPAAQLETCNLKDDDCDGQTDETTPGLCDDGQACTYDNCVSGQCQHPPATGACDDANACTSGEICQNGFCLGQAIACDDGNPCTKDGCAPASGCTTTAQDGPCDDGNACSINDLCKSGSCSPGDLALCDDGNGCTTDACDKAKGCLHTPNSLPCTDNDLCTTADICKNAACSPGASLPCSDGNPCTDDACNPLSGCTFTPNEAACSDGNVCTIADACAAGICVPGPAQKCDDGNSCTADSCDSKQGCVATPNNAACSDGNVCTTTDSCKAGSCQPGPVLACADGNPCSDDSCDPSKGCVFTPNSQPCDDANACTVGDTCKGGTCTPKKGLACDDGNPCTTDSCDITNGCQYLANSAPCNDGNLCTANDACAGGSCQGGALSVCEDGNACTSDSCDPSGGCIHLANAATCSDGNVCTGPDQCSNTICKPGAYLACDDANPCTTDSCDAVAGCTFVANKFPCSDGDACTDGDVCNNSSCQPGSAKVCDDGNPCTTDTCEKASGCKTSVAPDATPCGQGQCTAGLCTCPPGYSGSGLQCADIDECKTGVAKCDANATCSNLIGSYTCSCNAGWDGNGKTCNDIDECKTGALVCSANGTCTNTLGSANCTCNKGYSGDGKTCTDIDECKAGLLTCGTNATCSNTAGSAFCYCNTGYSGDGQTCTDVDECAAGTAGCSANATCANTPGAFVCTCKAGYSGDGKTCTDVDECAAGTAGCSVNATCANTPGSFSCTCKAGYVGDGKTCAGISLAFSTCAATGATGPSQGQCNTAYSGSQLAGTVTVTGGFQLWTVPGNGVYRIEAFGAGGGTQSPYGVGGLGARVRGDITLKAGQVLKILVGQKGKDGGSYDVGAGGGTFVALNDNTPLLVAGGGGAAGNCGATSPSGMAGKNTQGNGAGGASNNDGNWCGCGGEGSGGAGFTGNGGGGGGPLSFVNGGTGATGVRSGQCVGAGWGGFGGGGNGGNGGGGGGGYQGGIAGGAANGGSPWGGGGLSYLNGANQDSASGVQVGDGKLTITSL